MEIGNEKSMKYADKVQLLGAIFCLSIVSILLIVWESLWFSGTVIRLVFIFTLVLTPATVLGIGLYLIDRNKHPKVKIEVKYHEL